MRLCPKNMFAHNGRLKVSKPKYVSRKRKRGKNTQEQMKREIQKILKAYLFLENQAGEMKATWINNKRKKEKLGIVEERWVV